MSHQRSVSGNTMRDENTSLDIVELNQKLNAFLNGQMDSKWDIVIPFFLKGQISECHNKIRFAQIYEREIVELKRANPIESRFIKPATKFEEWRQTLNSDDKENFLRPVFELRDFIRSNFTQDEILGFYFHGSISTQDYVKYCSDFDTLVIVKKSVLNNEKWLYSFKERLTRSNTYLYLLDPLQHHGHFVITEYDLETYNQTIFPLNLFDFSTELSDFQNSLVFNVLPFPILHMRKSIFFWIEYFRKQGQLGFSLNSSYAVKQFVQSIFFLLTIYAELKSKQFYYKKFIFDLVRQDFDSKTWNLIEKSSMVRKNCEFHSIWPYQLRKFIGYCIHPRVLKRIHNDLDKSITKKILDIMGQNVLEEAYIFANIIKERLDLE